MIDKNEPNVDSLASGVAHVLENQIREGRYSVGSPLPAERQLSAEFGVSRGSIRAAIDDLLARGLIVQKPHHRPVVAVLPPSRPVGARNVGAWLWPNSSHFSAASILKGIQSTDFGANAQVIVASGAGENWESILDSEREFLETMAADPATMGVIVWYLGGELNLRSLQKLRDRNIPVVCVDRMPPVGFDVDFVGTNNIDSAMQAVQHLQRLGHRNIGMISNIDPASSVVDRESGYQRAMVEAGVEVKECWMQRVAYDSDASITSAVESMLQNSDALTAVFCVNDTVALQVLDILARLGVRVPDEFSVVGFDGLLSWVPGGGYLTTMRQGFERIGRIAAQIIRDRADAETQFVTRHYLLDAPLIIGASAGQPNPLRSRPEARSSSKETPYDKP